MSSQLEFHGPNAGYILELYDRYQDSPDAVDGTTRKFFERWNPPQGNGTQTAVTIESPTGIDLEKVFGAIRFARSIRRYGHLQAQLDPLGIKPPGDPELEPDAHRISYDDLRDLPAFLIGEPVASSSSNALEAIQQLEQIYSSSIGVDNDHIHIPEERGWLRHVFESRQYQFEGTPEQAKALLRRLSQIEAMELFLQRSFPSKYRFSIEGLDMMVPMLDEIISQARHTGITNIAIAMAHRGRLNVLAHVMEKPYKEILADFLDELHDKEVGWTVGDVKYHMGETREVIDSDGSIMEIEMPFNPSHLEVANPVALGMARAAGTKADQRGTPIFDPSRTMQILIHGDAAFIGQGVVAETFNLSRLPGYWSGGTIHIIANNQIGFTTLPIDARSTLYASDLAKGFQVPIFHVNADDPAAVIEVARIGFAYQEKFEKDFLIDLIGYRRYGHNELDEPGFTQPLMYQLVRDHERVRELWSTKLITEGVVTEEAPQNLLDEFTNSLQQELDELKENPIQEESLADLGVKPGIASGTETALTEERLRALNTSIEATLEGFNFYSRRFENTIRARRELGDLDEAKIDWAGAEEFAFASVLQDGIAIRLTGQDTERGTFSHRHSVLHHAETGETLTPLQQFSEANASFEVHNSPLSEEAVLAFEFGYNVEAPQRLVLWEAQYGDFANGAQNVIDEFIVSAREKWGVTPSIVLLLPHGHEGAGPDHSSARPERFLQMAAKMNIRIANCTTAAQYFHLLRRQALLLETDPLPLVVLAPKSLLRNPNVACSMNDIINGKFQPVIDDDGVNPDDIERVVFCSGKFYYDLIGSEYRGKHSEVAIIRVEQLYPFPAEQLTKVIERYPNRKQVVWAQEEPKNMGAWDFINYRLKKLVGIDLPVNYVGRRRSASPAEGHKSVALVNQEIVIEYAFNWDFVEKKPIRK